ncbi:hypothetical protein LJR231_002270 [Phyllobacterium sp. LjRoot231]|uniref:hypothetical protein n=1 Tax=Phyllobacterium sp. LjRoot231 TaxID=3342289 RepID=UPI003ECF5BE5
MANQISIRKGTAAEIAAFTGVMGELVMNETDVTVHVQDGVTPGGKRLAKYSELPNFGNNGVFDQTPTGFFWDPDGARIHRVHDRFLIDEAAATFDGSNNEFGSYVATVGGTGYIDRCATFASYSSRGGIGGAFASRVHDIYRSFPLQHPGPVPSVWTSGGTATLGQRVAYGGRVYNITTGGTYSTTPPAHITGSAANGTATLQFVDFTYMTSAALTAFAIQDSPDPDTCAFAMYAEVVNTEPTPSYIAEWNAKNKTALNPVNGPYSRFAMCMGLGLAAGGDPNAGAPTNPSSSAILIYRNGHTWNTGIVFDAIGITGTDGVTGFGTAIKMARGHVVTWQYAGSNNGFDLVSTVDTANSKQTLSIDNTGASFLNNSGLANFKVTAVAGTVTGHLEAVGSTAAQPALKADGTAANITINHQPKGTGTNYSTAFWAGNADGSFGGKLQMRGNFGASYVSFRQNGANLEIYVDATLFKTI